MNTPKADAIMFYGMHPGMKYRMKKLKQLRLEAKNATFIFHVREPPTLTLSLGNWSENFFDATMSYRRDSDIFNALYQLVPKNTESFNTVYNLLLSEKSIGKFLNTLHSALRDLGSIP